MENRTGLPVHPITGEQALGFWKGNRPIWPIKGGAEDTPAPGSSEAGAPLVENGNPAWNDFLKYVPEDQRQEVVPVLKQWDENYNQVQQEYKPWESVVKGGLDPDTVQFATEVLSALQENPRKIYDSLGEHFGWTPEEVEEALEDSGQGLEDGGEQFALEDYPAFQQLQQQNKVFAEILLQQRQQDLAAEADVRLNSELTAAKQKHGEFDEEYVLMRMAQSNEDVETAVANYYQFAEKFGGKKPAPRLHGGSGGGAVPSPKLKPKEMTDKDVRNMMVSMLESSNQES